MATLEFDHIITILVALLSLIGSVVTFFFTRRERAARITSEQAQAKQAEASAAQHFSEAAASAVETMMRIKTQLEEELEEARKQIERTEARTSLLDDSLNELIEKSAECVEENTRLMNRNVVLKKENEELRSRVEELELENQRLLKKITILEDKLSKLETYVGLTGEHEKIE